MAKKITVLICDDSAFIRQVMTAFIAAETDMEVVGTAIDPYDAREKIKQLNPDVLTLDIEMPKMDGLSFLEKIMALRPMSVIMVSTLTQRGAAATLRALELGAFDYLGKPGEGLQGRAAEAFRAELLSKIRAAAESNIAEQYRARMQRRAPAALGYQPGAHAPELIAIGASTGGVEALRDIFLQLPAGLPPIVMTQHIPRQFSFSLAERLHALSAVEVAVAKQGAVLEGGHAYLAPGGEHLRVVRRNGKLVSQVREGHPVSGHCPSVDVLFESVAQTAGGKALGVILTGMGRDGAQGLLAMHQAGAYTIGQDAASCVVYGMPRAAEQLGALAEQRPLHHIAAAIVHHCEQGGSHVA